MVFFNNIAIVMGPMPPGTGVNHFAFFSTSFLLVSPIHPVLSLFLFMATSITVAPDFMCLPVIRSGLPTAVTNMSAVEVMSERCFVREWHTVTVASCCKNSWAVGLPTMFDRPIITTFFPDIFIL